MDSLILLLYLLLTLTYKSLTSTVLNVVEGLGVNTNLPGFLLSIIDIDLPVCCAY